MDGLVKLYRDVMGGGVCNRTATQLLSDFGIDASTGLLGAIVELQAKLGEHGLESVPNLLIGDQNTVRVIRAADQSEWTSSAVCAEILRGESGSVEFKETLCFDTRQRLANAGLPLDRYKSIALTHASIKTIAAFLNSDGGTLYIGVRDNGAVGGLAPDYQLSATCNADRFQLFLRDTARTWIHDGNMASDFIDCRIIQLDGNDIARVRVLRRPKRISILTKTDQGTNHYQLYRRDGNRTVEVKLPDVEEFVLSRHGRL